MIFFEKRLKLLENSLTFKGLRCKDRCHLIKMESIDSSRS
jgi:hypothetical protein